MGQIVRVRLKDGAEPVSSLTNPLARAVLAVAVTTDFGIRLFANNELHNALRSAVSPEDIAYCNCHGIPCFFCPLTSTVVRAVASGISDIAKELVSRREPHMAEIAEIKPQSKKGAEPLSELAKQLDSDAKAILLVVIMTKDYEVQYFAGEQAFDVMKRTLASGEIVLRRCEGFPMPSAWCSVTDAVGEAVTSYLADIAQGAK